MTEKRWTMPAHLERYRDLINNTGGNTIEELMNDHSCTAVTNAPLALICVSVESQMTLLERLHRSGLLTPCA